MFKKGNFKPFGYIIKAKRASVEWRIRNCLLVDDYFTGRSFGPVTKHKLVEWQPQSPGSVKINFDGSLQNTSAAGGYIICD